MKYKGIGPGEMVEILLATGHDPYEAPGKIDWQKVEAYAKALGYRVEAEPDRTFYPDMKQSHLASRYAWPGMKVISMAEALARYMINREVYLLDQGDTPGVAKSAMDIFDHAQQGGDFGYET